MNKILYLTLRGCQPPAKRGGLAVTLTSASVKNKPHIQPQLLFTDTQSPNKKPKALEFPQRSTKNIEEKE